MLRSLMSQDELALDIGMTAKVAALGLACLDLLSQSQTSWFEQVLAGAVDARPILRYSLTGWGRRDPEDEIAFDEVTGLLTNADQAEAIARSLIPGAAISLFRPAGGAWTCTIHSVEGTAVATDPVLALAILRAATDGEATPEEIAAERADLLAALEAQGAEIPMPEDGCWRIVCVAELPSGGLGVVAGGETVTAPQFIQPGDAAALVPAGSLVPDSVAESIRFHGGLDEDMRPDPDLEYASDSYFSDVLARQGDAWISTRAFLIHQGCDPVEPACILSYAPTPRGSSAEAFPVGTLLNPEVLNASPGI